MYKALLIILVVSTFFHMSLFYNLRGSSRVTPQIFSHNFKTKTFKFYFLEYYTFFNSNRVSGKNIITKTIKFWEPKKFNFGECFFFSTIYRSLFFYLNYIFQNQLENILLQFHQIGFLNCTSWYSPIENANK